MTGEETFEFAAAVAGVSIGLAAVLLLAVLAIVGTWRLFKHAAEAQQAATRASLSVEEMARRVGLETGGEQGGQLASLQSQVEVLVLQQRQLQDTARGLLDGAVSGVDGTSLELEELATTVGRLDTTVGQMATSLANLIRLLEQRQDSR